MINLFWKLIYSKNYGTKLNLSYKLSNQVAIGLIIL